MASAAPGAGTPVRPRGRRGAEIADPGCACDVPSHWYSLSTEKNPNWSQVYSSQPEIEECTMLLRRPR